MLESEHAARAALVAAQRVRAEAERRAVVGCAQRASVKDGLADERVVQAISPAPAGVALRSQRTELSM
jgi:hypothetical protein